MTTHRARKHATRAHARATGLSYAAAHRTRHAPSALFQGTVGHQVSDGADAVLTLPDSRPPICLVTGPTGSGYTALTAAVGTAIAHGQPGIHSITVDPCDWAGRHGPQLASSTPADEGLHAALEGALKTRAPHLVTYCFDPALMSDHRRTQTLELLQAFGRTARSRNARLVLGLNAYHLGHVADLVNQVAASVVVGYNNPPHVWDALRLAEPQDLEHAGIGAGWVNTGGTSAAVRFNLPPAPPSPALSTEP